MGIDPSQITDAMLERDASGSLRKLRAKAMGHVNAALTHAESSAKAVRKLEREEQRILARWLAIQEENGILVYDWSAIHRKATRREGMPDFSVWKGGRALLGEMKASGGKLSEEQRIIIEAFARSGTEVEIWSSADVAIRRIKNWLWTQWRLWDNEATEAP
jgi:hypothetical protein